MPRRALVALREQPSVNRVVRRLLRTSVRLGSRLLDAGEHVTQRWPVFGEERLSLAGSSFKVFGGEQDQVLSALYYGTEWESGELRAWARIVFDVGANTGMYTLLAAASSAAQVWAFEPNPSNLAALRRNVTLNSWDDRVRVEPVAVGASAGTVDLHLPKAPVSSLVSSVSAAFTAAYSPGIECHTLSTTQVSLDDVCAREKCVPDIVKIDVESHELEVLMGARQLLSSHRPTMLCEILETDYLLSRHPELDAVLDPHHREKAQKLFDSMGYAAYAVVPTGLARVTSICGVPGNNFLLSGTRTPEWFIPFDDRTAVARLARQK